eukprot:g15931.t1
MAPAKVRVMDGPVAAVPQPIKLGTDGAPAGTSLSEGKRRSHAEFLKNKAGRAMTHAAAFLSLGLLLEFGAAFWTLGQAVASGVFDEADCGFRALAVYHNSRLPQNCQRLDSSVVWFDETRTFETFTSCSGGVEDPQVEQLCDCSRYDKVSSGCVWAAASSTKEEIEGLCLAVPVIALTPDVQELYGTTYDYLLDSSEFEFQNECTPLTPAGFGDITIALLVVSLVIGLVEAYVGYRRWKNPLRGSGLIVVASAVEGGGILSVWCLLMFAPHGIVRAQAEEAQVSENQYRFLVVLLTLVAVLTVGGTAAEITFHRSAKAHERLPYLGVFGNALIWLASGVIEVLVTAYLVWRLQFWKGQDDDEEAERNWPVLVGAVIGLVVLEVVALLAVWAARFFFARARRQARDPLEPKAGEAAGNMELLGCADDCGDLALFLDVLECAEPSAQDSAPTSDRRNWEQQRAAEYSGGASRYGARRGISSVSRGPCGQRPQRTWTQAGQDVIDSEYRPGDGLVKRKSHPLCGDSGDFGATMTPGVNPASVPPAAGSEETTPPGEGTVDRFFFTDGDSDPDPDGRAIAPALVEASEAAHAAVAATATVATYSARVGAEKTAAIAKTMTSLFSPATTSPATMTAPTNNGVHARRTSEIRQHQLPSQVSSSIPPRPPRPADKASMSKCLGHAQVSPMSRIATLAARSRFSSDMDEYRFSGDLDDELEAKDDDSDGGGDDGAHDNDGDGDGESHNDSLVLDRPSAQPGMAAAVTSVAASSSPPGAISSTVTSSSAFNSEQGREHGTLALQALAAEITSSSTWTVAVNDPIIAINKPCATAPGPTAAAAKTTRTTAAASITTATTATATATPTATAAPSPLLVHTSAVTSYSDLAATTHLVASALVPPRTNSSSRAVVGTDEEEKLDFLSDVSDSDQSEIMTASPAVNSSSQTSARGGDGGALPPPRKPLAHAEYVSSSSVSWASSYPQDDEAGVPSTEESDATVGGDGSLSSSGGVRICPDGKASRTGSFHSGVEGGPLVVAVEERGGGSRIADFKEEPPIRLMVDRPGPRLGPSSSTTTSPDVDVLMRSRNQNLDFDSCVVEALASSARSVDRRVHFRRGWSDFSSRDDDAESCHHVGAWISAPEYKEHAAPSNQVQTPIAKTCVSTHLRHLCLSPTGGTVIVQRPRDEFKKYEFALGDIIKVKEDVSAETVTLIRSDMKLRISFEGQPTALRKFSAMLMMPMRPETHASTAGKAGRDERVAGRTVNVACLQEEDDEEAPIGHPERLVPTPHSFTSSTFATTRPPSGAPTMKAFPPARGDNSGPHNHHEHELSLSPPVNRESGGGRASGGDGGGAGSSASVFNSGAAGSSSQPSVSVSVSPELEPMSSPVVMEEGADRGQVCTAAAVERVGVFGSERADVVCVRGDRGFGDGASRLAAAALEEGQDEEEDEQHWPVLVGGVVGLVVLEVVALSAVWATCFFFAMIKHFLLGP